MIAADVLVARTNIIARGQKAEYTSPLKTGAQQPAAEKVKSLFKGIVGFFILAGIALIIAGAILHGSGGDTPGFLFGAGGASIACAIFCIFVGKDEIENARIEEAFAQAQAEIAQSN